MSSKFLVTGGSGYIGKKFIQSLIDRKELVIPITRKKTNIVNSKYISNCIFSDIQSLEIKDLIDLGRVDTAIHIAAKAHVSGVDLSEYRLVNTDATLRFAKFCSEIGVKRFIFLSSIGVNGISNTSPFSTADSPAPVEGYAVSKFEAEVGLRKIAAETGMEIVIIRPPLVYGPNAPGNFGKLAKLASKNLPLPFGAIYNKRSLVSLDNLVDLIITCIDHPNAANQTFLVSDDHDVSTTELLNAMTLASGKQPRLIPVPVSVLRLAGRLTGKLGVIDRLCGNLQVDISHTKDVLGWKPPVSFQDGIQKCFQKEQKND